LNDLNVWNVLNGNLSLRDHSLFHRVPINIREEGVDILCALRRFVIEQKCVAATTSFLKGATDMPARHWNIEMMEDWNNGIME
jgi:hypothetical protein